MNWKSPSLGVWLAATLTLIVCWTSMLLGPVTVIIFPAIAVGFAVAARRRKWIPLLLILILNPLMLFFAWGITDYLRGRPYLMFMGLPRLESFNLDRQTRCFRAGGGCIVHESEWVAIEPHNLALSAMCAIFGPPRESYAGPYPSKEEALRALGSGSRISWPSFQSGQFKLPDGQTRLEDGVAEKLSGFPPFVDLVDPEYPPQVDVASYQGQCLVLRLRTNTQMPNYSSDVLILIDRRKGRPFAYYWLNGKWGYQFPPVMYYDQP